MRILIQTFGSAGDVHPFIAVGKGLRARGHDVRLWANEWFRPVVEAAGLSFRFAGEAAEYEAAQTDEDLWHARRGPATVVGRYLAPNLEATTTSLASEVRLGDTLLVGGILGFAARIVRETHAVPLVTLHLAPSAFVSVERPPLLPGLSLGPKSPRWLRKFLLRVAFGIADRVAVPSIEAVRRPRGLPPARHVFDTWIHSPDRVIGLFPEWFASPERDWPANVTLTGFPLYDESDVRRPDPELDAWIDDGDPPIVFTPGSGNRVVGRFLRESVEATRQIGRRALLVMRTPEGGSPDLPQHARLVDYAPFGRILPRAAALVSHCGIGTCAQALATGTPHLAMPIGFDQFDNASRVVAWGAGTSLPARRYRARRAAHALEQLLGDSRIGARALEAADLLAGRDAVQKTCDAIEATQLAGDTATVATWRDAPARR